MIEKIQATITSLQNQLAELAGLMKAFTEGVKEGAQHELKEQEQKEQSEADLRTHALVTFLKTGDVTHVAPDGILTKKDPLRPIFAPYVFCTVTKTSGKTVYFIRASDPMGRERTAVLSPDLVENIKPGKCVIYHNKIVTQWCPLEEAMWRDCGRAFNALFRA